MYIKKLHPDAFLPKRMTSGSAGYDLYSLEDGIIKPGEKVIVRTGISIRLPTSKCFASIRSRSGLSYKYSIEVGQ